MRPGQVNHMLSSMNAGTTRSQAKNDATESSCCLLLNEVSMYKAKLALCALFLTAALSACYSGATTTTTTANVTPGPAATTPSDAQTTKVVDAANTFLGALSAAQKSAVTFAWTDAAQRARWSNFPTGIFQRAGVKWGNLSSAQRTALTTLLSTVLSADGLKMVQQQMAADDVLKSQGGGNLTFGSDEYYVSFLGSPSTMTAWTLPVRWASPGDQRDGGRQQHHPGAQSDRWAADLHHCQRPERHCR